VTQDNGTYNEFHEIGTVDDNDLIELFQKADRGRYVCREDKTYVSEGGW
jgi:hypothetical protein